MKHQLRSLLAILAAILGSSTLHAASVNDSYASRSTLLTGVASTANNTGGSLEAGEQIPAGVNAANYQATLWWQFTPAMNGWYELSTAGSQCPTILTLWSGGGADLGGSPPAPVQVGSQSLGGKVSLWFNATAGTAYQIAVAANGSGRGNVTLNAAYIPDPFAQVNAVTFSSGSADVSGGAVPGSVTLGISASREITGGSFALSDPVGQTIVNVPLSAANRTAGNVASGTYVANFTLPQYIKPGAYAWTARFTNAALHRSSTQGGGAQLAAPAIAGNSGTLLVQNSGGVDTYGLWLAQNDPAALASITGADGTLNLGALLGSAGAGSAQSLRQFAFGLDPAQDRGQAFTFNGGISPGLPQISPAPDAGGKGQRLNVQFVSRMNDTSLNYTVQFSNDLVNWSNSTAAPSALGNDGTYQILQVQDTESTATTSRRFARVKVTRALP